MRGAILQDCDFRKADLRGAILSSTCRLPKYGSAEEIVMFYLNSSDKDKKILENIFKPTKYE